MNRRCAHLLPDDAVQPFPARGWIICALLAVSASWAPAQHAALMYGDLVKPKDAVFDHVPIGLCEDYPEETTTLEVIQKDMELLNRADIRLLRISFGWDAIEAAKDTYTWGFWDDYVRTAVDDYGITLVPYICYTPRWNSTGDSLNFWNHTPRDYDEFGQFVFDLVTRYKDRIKSWELWNEPDISAYWSGTAGDLARLTKIGAEAVKRADPEALVILAGLAGHTNFTEELFRDHQISECVDVVNCHNYFETWNGQPIENITVYINTLADIIARYGRGQSLWMAEVGYSTYRQADGTVCPWYHATYAYEHTPAFQATQLVRTLALALSTNKLSALTWYELKDLPPQENVIGDENNRHLGVADAAHAPKPAQKALTFAANTLFRQKIRCIDDRVTVRRTIGSESEVHCFENEDGSVLVVGWLKTNVPGKQRTGPVGNLKDARTETIALTLPVRCSGRASLYDALGTEEAFAGVDNTGATTGVNDIRLSGGGVTIIHIAR